VAGYVASARLQGSVPHFVGGSGVTSWSESGAPITGAMSTHEPPLVADRIELVGRPLDEVIGERLASLGESWSQLTFFLFDPESWR
jgi:hypothetical protein